VRHTTQQAPFFAVRWWQLWAKALRLQHWAKNALVFTAPVLSLGIISSDVLTQALLLFVLMGVLASATYLINDLADLEADRRHPRKRHRPFAAGDLPYRHGTVAAVALICVAMAGSFALPVGCTAALAAYLLTTLAYSFVFKRQPIVDVVVLAGLFTLRVIAGGFTVPTFVSPWLLTFAMLFFLGLALVKRYAELERVVRFGASGIDSRGYTAKDLPLLLAAGVSTGVASTVIVAIYLTNEHYQRDIYQNPQALWGIVPLLLLWVLRIWHLTVHGRMHEDPVVFALRDGPSAVLGGLTAGLLLLAWFWPR
jgi:4-hydroxybenzoate polyprenyltransferase